MSIDLHPVSVAKFSYAFQCLDRDANGVLGAEDFVSVAAGLARLRGWPDGDPRVDTMQTELTDYWEMLCMLSDEDGSGAVDLDEWLAFHQMMIAETKEFGAAPPWALALVEALLAALDADGDGKIDLGEYAHFLAAIGSEMEPTAAFQKLDVDGSGFLELSELGTLIAEYMTSTSVEEPGNYLLTGGWPS